MMIIRHCQTWRENFRAWRRYLRAIEQMDRLSDRELAELGIDRTDIPQIARGML
jgi:uncharacterized protein YjiS (DUF1127 family)